MHNGSQQYGNHNTYHRHRPRGRALLKGSTRNRAPANSQSIRISTFYLSTIVSMIQKCPRGNNT